MQRLWAAIFRRRINRYPLTSKIALSALRIALSVGRRVRGSMFRSQKPGVRSQKSRKSEWKKRVQRFRRLLCGNVFLLTPDSWLLLFSVPLWLSQVFDRRASASDERHHHGNQAEQRRNSQRQPQRSHVAADGKGLPVEHTAESRDPIGQGIQFHDPLNPTRSPGGGEQGAGKQPRGHEDEVQDRVETMGGVHPPG